MQLQASDGNVASSFHAFRVTGLLNRCTFTRNAEHGEQQRNFLVIRRAHVSARLFRPTKHDGATARP
jgi:hypothetical protein